MGPGALRVKSSRTGNSGGKGPEMHYLPLAPYRGTRRTCPMFAEKNNYQFPSRRHPLPVNKMISPPILQSMVNQINKTVDNKIYSTKYLSPFPITSTF